MKIYPYQTPNGIIELVEKREYDKLEAAIAAYESSNLDLVNPIDEAVKRMEAVPMDEIEDVYFDNASMGVEEIQLPDDHAEALIAVRARLIQAAKGEL